MNDLTLVLSQPTNKLVIHKSIIEALGNPKFFHMALNQEKHSLLLVGCSGRRKNEPVPNVVPQLVDGQYEIYAKPFLRYMKCLLNWKDHSAHFVQGNYIGEYNVVVFPLDEAKVE